jgi:hypothetical protein
MAGQYSVTRQTIKLSRAWMVRSYAFGEKSVAGYDDGMKEASRHYARPGIDKSPDAQTLGKASEVAFCLDLCLDPLTKLDWTPMPDPGWDLIVRERKIDVKGSDTEMLMWPVTKNEFLEHCPAHLFVLVRRLSRPHGKTMEDIIACDTFEISGWITVKEFIAKHHVADASSWMDENTKHMHMDELRPFTDATRAGYPNGFVGYSREGHFIHFCHCGRYAGHGSGTNLLKERFGKWLCDQHKKEKDDVRKERAEAEDRTA